MEQRTDYVTATTCHDIINPLSRDITHGNRH